MEQGSRYKSLDFSSIGPGYYELAIYPDLDGSGELARTSFSIFDDREFLSGKESVFGMNIHSQRGFLGWSPALVEECRNIGSMNIRDDIEWSGTEQEKGVYNCTYQCADYIYKNNMEYVVSTGFNNKFYDNGATPYTDEGWTGFANFSKALYDLYPKNLGGLTNMEVYNEWFAPERLGNDGFDGDADSLPETYIPLLKKTYETVKAAYPDSVLFGQLCYDDEWVQRSIDAGVDEYMDALSLHVYPNNEFTANGKPEIDVDPIKKYKKMLKEKSGKDFDIWITETGANTALNGYVNFTEREQAEAVPRVHMALLEAGVQKIFWYCLIDESTELVLGAAHEYNWGLLRAKESRYGAYTPKPSYVSYGVMTKMLDGKDFVGKEMLGDAYCYTFSDGTNNMYALYSFAPQTVTIQTADELKITDIMGKETIHKPKNGQVTLNIDTSVQYIEGNVQSWRN